MKIYWKHLASLPPPDLTMVRYDKTQDYIKTSVAYQGILHKHPYETDTVILLGHPFGKPAICYEFKVSDITKVEDLPNIVTESGENIRIVNLWIRKGSYGLIMQAFEVPSEDGAKPQTFPPGRKFS